MKKTLFFAFVSSLSLLAGTVVNAETDIPSPAGWDCNKVQNLKTQGIVICSDSQNSNNLLYFVKRENDEVAKSFKTAREFITFTNKALNFKSRCRDGFKADYDEETENSIICTYYCADGKNSEVGVEKVLLIGSTSYRAHVGISTNKFLDIGNPSSETQRLSSKWKQYIHSVKFE